MGNWQLLFLQVLGIWIFGVYICALCYCWVSLLAMTPNNSKVHKYIRQMLKGIFFVSRTLTSFLACKSSFSLINTWIKRSIILRHYVVPMYSFKYIMSVFQACACTSRLRLTENRFTRDEKSTNCSPVTVSGCMDEYSQRTNRFRFRPCDVISTRIFVF